MSERLARVLKPYGYEWLVAAVGISGPGNLVVTFAAPGDFFTACVTHDDRVLWCLSCGGTKDGYTDKAIYAFLLATIACTGNEPK
jgi:hypothetical protein